MNRILSLIFVLSSFGAYAAAPVGSLEVYSDLDNSSVLVGNFVVPTFQIEDQGGKITGASGETVYLERQNGGYKGFVGRRPFNMICTLTACTDIGPTEMNIKITPIDGGFKLRGTLNYVFVNAVVTGTQISVSAVGTSTDESFDLLKQPNGSYSGQGVAQAYETFHMSVNATGSLATVLTDPATIIVLLMSPIVIE